ncbi:MAG: hypothetical protein QM784_03840 [Polyangiaceae bacterium]
MARHWKADTVRRHWRDRRRQQYAELVAERDMLFRWFVDRSAFLVIGTDPERTQRLHDNLSALLLAASKKDPQWLENARAERRIANLYKLVSLS